MKPCIFLGAGGHARVVANMAKLLGISIIGFVDPCYHQQPKLCAHLLGGDEVIEQYKPENVALVNGVGFIKCNAVRKKLYEKYRTMGYEFASIIHPKATIADDVILEQGVQIMANVTIQTGVRISANCIINTGAIIDHDCVIGKHSHIAPGAVLSGGVIVSDSVLIGTGAMIIQSVNIGSDTVIGAGVAITKPIANNCIVYPAKPTIIVKELSTV